MSDYSQQIVQAGFQLGFGGPNDPRRRRAPYNVGYEAATPAEARPTPAGVGGEQAATNTTSRPNTPQKSMSDVFWNETNIGKALGGIWSGITLPRDVWEGKVDPRSEEGIQRAADMAGVAMTGGVGGVSTQAGEQVLGSTMARRMQELGPTYRHGVGVNKLRVPLEEMTAVRTPTGELAPRLSLSPEELQGSVLVPAVGDRTMAGHRLSNINGQDLAWDVDLRGGADFMRTGNSWASHANVINPLAKTVRAAGKDGTDVNLVYSAMGPQSGDFAHMTSDALLAQVPGRNIDAKALMAFDADMRRKFPQWAGLNDPQAVRAQLFDPKTGGKLRTNFVKTMEKAPYQDAGFPDVPSARWATTEPELLNAGKEAKASTGYAVTRADPNAQVTKNIDNPHPSYPATLLGGEYRGGTPDIPRELMFPDFFKARRAAGAPIGSDRRSFEVNSTKIIQPANQEWLDPIMRYLEGR